jgi:AAA+ superfamily predicted ATPase
MSSFPDLASQWMSLWLAASQARIDVALHDAAGKRADAALAALTSLDAQVAQLRAEAAGVPATWLRSRLGLTATEEAVVWMLAAGACSPAVRTAAGALVGGVDEITLDAIERVVYREPSLPLTAWRELGANGALRQLGLLQLGERDRQGPDHRQALHLVDRVRGLLLGDTSIAAEVSRFAEPMRPALALDRVIAPEGVVERARALAQAPRAFVLAIGPTGAGRRTLLRAAIAAAGRDAIEVDGTALAKRGDELRAQLQALVREARLLDRVLLVRSLDALLAGEGAEERAAIVEHLLGRAAVAVFATARRRPSTLGSACPIVALELGPVTSAQRAILWTRALPSMSEQTAAIAAARLPLAPAVIDTVGAAITARGTEPVDLHLIRATIDEACDARLAGLAERVTVTQTWDDLVLPDEQHDALVELVARVRERSRVYEAWGFGAKVGKGLGVAALFSGPPGTGKTMAAGLVANALGLPLYRVDLAQLVSKYIGETEKSLAALFDAAESTACVLLFDEADSLFGKRTEVKSSNDRYANLEVNYLLQRLDSFTGICLLTTNHERAIDEAFTRRLALHVRFPMPEEDQRARLWAALLPADAPVSTNLDLDALGRRVELSGGHIRNAVVRAAFLAASSESPITMGYLWHAARLEYEAIGKLAPAA